MKKFLIMLILLLLSSNISFGGWVRPSGSEGVYIQNLRVGTPTKQYPNLEGKIEGDSAFVNFLQSAKWNGVDTSYWKLDSSNYYNDSLRIYFKYGVFKIKIDSVTWSALCDSSKVSDVSWLCYDKDTIVSIGYFTGDTLSISERNRGTYAKVKISRVAYSDSTGKTVYSWDSDKLDGKHDTDFISSTTKDTGYGDYYWQKKTYVRPQIGHGISLNIVNPGGDNSFVHPDVRFIEGTNHYWGNVAYKYGMAVGPYGNFLETEAPCFYVSNDGINWVEPNLNYGNPIFKGYTGNPDFSDCDFCGEDIVFRNQTSNRLLKVNTYRGGWSDTLTIISSFTDLSPAFYAYSTSPYDTQYMYSVDATCSPNIVRLRKFNVDGDTFHTFLDTVTIDSIPSGWEVWHLDVYYHRMLLVIVPTGGTGTVSRLMLAHGENVNWVCYPNKIIRESEEYNNTTYSKNHSNEGYPYRGSIMYDTLTDYYKIWYSRQMRASPGSYTLAYTEGYWDDDTLPQRLNLTNEVKFKGFSSGNENVFPGIRIYQRECFSDDSLFLGNAGIVLTGRYPTMNVYPIDWQNPDVYKNWYSWRHDTNKVVLTWGDTLNKDTLLEITKTQMIGKQAVFNSYLNLPDTISYSDSSGKSDSSDISADAHLVQGKDTVWIKDQAGGLDSTEIAEANFAQLSQIRDSAIVALNDSLAKVRADAGDTARTTLNDSMSAITARYEGAIGDTAGDLRIEIGDSIAAHPSSSAKDTFFICASDATPNEKALSPWVCLGTSNDDSLIRRIVGVAKTSGGVIKLSTGNFMITSSIYLQDGVHWDGVFGKTILKPTANSTLIMRADSLDVGDCKISGIYFHYNSKTSCAGISTGIKSTTSNTNYGKFIVEYCKFYGLAYGITTISMGIYQEFEVKNSHFGSCGSGGINSCIVNAHDNVISLCNPGINILSNSKVRNNKFNDWGSGYIGVSTSTNHGYCMIQGNEYQYYAYPVYLGTNSSYNNISNNIINDPRGAYSIYIPATCSDNIISNNTINIPNAYNCVYITATTAKRNIIVGNTFTTTTAPTILDGGYKTLIANNTISTGASLSCVRLIGRGTIVNPNTFTSGTATNLIRMVGTDSCNISVTTSSPCASIAVWDSNGTYNRITGSGTLWSGKRNFTSTWTADTFVNTEFSVNSKFIVSWLGTTVPNSIVYPITGKEDTVIFVLLGGVNDTTKARAEGIYWKREDTN